MEVDLSKLEVGDTVNIPLTQGRQAIIDAADYDEVSKYKWCYSKDQGAVSATERGKGTGTNIMMHRLILKPESYEFIDHINHNRLDNRRSNIRICTKSQNAMNTKPVTGAISKYKGVSKNKSKTNPWRARVKLNQREEYASYHKTELEAAKAYDLAALRIFGEFAYINGVQS